MKCRDVSELLNSYIENGLDPLKDRGISEHLDSCQKCREEYEFLTKYHTILKGIKSSSAPDNFLHDLKGKIEAEKMQNPLERFTRALNEFRAGLRFPVEAAGLLAIAAVVFFLYKPFFISEKTDFQKEYAASKNTAVTEKKYSPPPVMKKPSAEKNNIKRVRSTEPVYSEDIADDIQPEIRAEESLSESGKDESARRSKKIKSLFFRSDSESGRARTIQKEDRAAESDTGDSASFSEGAAEKLKTAPVREDTDRLLTDSGAVIVKKVVRDGLTEYTIQISPEKSLLLIKKLERNYKVSSRILNTTESLLVMEITLKEK